MIAHWDEVEGERLEEGHLCGTWTDLGEAAGTKRVGVTRIQVEPGRWSTPAHIELDEEEIFVVLAGSGSLELWPPVGEPGEPEQQPIRAGHVISRPPATRIAHRFVGGDDGLTYLAYGTREPNDIYYYPRSNKIYWRGVGLIGRLEHLAYWEGEPED